MYSLFSAKLASKKIESLLDGSDPKIEQILAEDKLIEALNQNRPKVTNYVIKHFKEIIDIAIGNTEIDTPEILSTATSIFMSPANGIVDKFHTDRSLVQMVADILIESEAECRCLFRFITAIMVRTNGIILSYIKDPVKFYQSALARVTNPAAHEFILTLFERKRAFAQIFAEKVEADVLTLALVHQGESHACIAMRIVSKIVEISETECKVIKRMSSPDTFSFILSIALDAATVELSNASWLVIYSILKKNDSVKEMIESQVEQICRFIGDCHPFTPDKRNCARVLLASISENIDHMYALCGTLLQQLEVQRSNSFLHITVLEMFTRIANGDQEHFSLFLQENNVIGALLALESCRDEIVDLGCWGHMTAMEELVLSKFGDALTPDWNAFVNNCLKPRIATRKEAYGGDLPAREVYDGDSDSELQYQCRFADSSDLLDRLLGFTYEGYEEEEEEEEEGHNIYIAYSSSEEEDHE